MATVAEWVAGARPRTLPAALAPVAVGTGAAHALGESDLGLALLALIVAVALQVGVNYANDYSDGVRGTDATRVGPMRLVGSGAADPALVKAAAFLSFGTAAVTGLALVALSNAWLLLLVGALAILAAWRYTGGARPYGYRGLGELAVFVFFGLVAVLGTQWTQAGALSLAGVAGAVGVGAFACAILMANNLRDIPGDREVGKRTLAVQLGDTRTRTSYLALVVLAYAMVPVAALGSGSGWALLALLAAPTAWPAVRTVRSRATGADLVPVLGGTGLAQLAYAALLTLGLVLST
ncbi:1,4-dihydroxy-2-naphthoate polyprenyltransferase [Ornithinimicrobium sediminis]|uniref:1,4-dihydroxy-2-naphthoate polyprenyltransferase n=1 Tax=Ornithinimicrobium sediminis TaxID=2904603 RepID=UPI001E501F25|nr:1,4-dihydroxy-2-naphthoate polyprenyltransferase [Ornithinimicrobium sediminis]MCE0485754.1 1,4-dihydroxy-2-naphthoate polyprenyltransferase [Ornithinimicrobium sediminis]